jgi:hypothetical protein
MTIYVDPVEASHVLAQAAADVVYGAAKADIGEAIDRLRQAVEHYELTKLSSPVPAFRPYRRHRAPVMDERQTDKNQGHAYRAALTTVDWRAQNPAGLADLMIEMCCITAARHQIPNLDPAVMLVASKIATVCGLAVDDDHVAALIADVHRRSKA